MATGNRLDHTAQEVDDSIYAVDALEGTSQPILTSVAFTEALVTAPNATDETKIRTSAKYTEDLTTGSTSATNVIDASSYVKILEAATAVTAGELKASEVYTSALVPTPTLVNGFDARITTAQNTATTADGKADAINSTAVFKNPDAIASTGGANSTLSVSTTYDDLLAYVHTLTQLLKTSGII